MEVQVEAGWRKSSYSGNGGGTCVEVGEGRHSVLVRDTKQNGAGPILRFPPAVWRRFAAQVKRSLAAGPHRAASSIRAAARSAAVTASSLLGTMRTTVPALSYGDRYGGNRLIEPKLRDPEDTNACCDLGMTHDWAG
jgi:Domain of unknown function (DUF397)